MENPKDFQISCPVPSAESPKILLGHGSGGRLMHRLLEQVILPPLENPLLRDKKDATVISIGEERLAFTTDSYVVSPLFFPGGDIGSLAVNGTVNDLAMVGATPLYLSLALILEEGLEMETLQRILSSIQKAAQQAGVKVVTGDTKVVDKGKGDGIYINTSGIGFIKHSLDISPQQVRPGDAILVNGYLGDHGIAVLSVREGLDFETTITSDTAPLNELVQILLDADLEIHCLRDLTRGGLASGLNEIVKTAQVGIRIWERSLPLREEVLSACELLGLDPLYVANEGKFVLFLPSSQAEEALALLKSHPLGQSASLIGVVMEKDPGLVLLESKIGGTRVVDMLAGEQLPRIC